MYFVLLQPSELGSSDRNASGHRECAMAQTRALAERSDAEDRKRRAVRDDPTRCEASDESHGTRRGRHEDERARGGRRDPGCALPGSGSGRAGPSVTAAGRLRGEAGAATTVGSGLSSIGFLGCDHRASAAQGRSKRETQDHDRGKAADARAQGWHSRRWDHSHRPGVKGRLSTLQALTPRRVRRFEPAAALRSRATRS